MDLEGRSPSPEFVVRPVVRTYARRSRSKSSGGRSDSEAPSEAEGGKSESEARSDVEEVVSAFRSSAATQDDLESEDLPAVSSSHEKTTVDLSAEHEEGESEIMEEQELEAEAVKSEPIIMSASEECSVSSASVEIELKEDTNSHIKDMAMESSDEVQSMETVEDISMIETKDVVDPPLETEEESLKPSSPLQPIKKKNAKRKSRKDSMEVNEPETPTNLRRTSRVIKKTGPREVDYGKPQTNKESKKAEVKTKAVAKQYDPKLKVKLDKKKSKSDTNLLASSGEQLGSDPAAPLLRSIHKTVGKFKYLASSDDAESSSGSPTADFDKQVAAALKDLSVREKLEDGSFQVGQHRPGISRSAPATPVAVKVKSRWRRSSELDFHDSDSDSTIQDSPGVPVPSERRQLTEEEATELKQRLKEFEQIDANSFLTKKSISKEKMHCDCALSKEEIANGEKGCLEDCLNRLLMIECGPDCFLGANCMNKRFQERMNANIDVFKTSKKGFGLRAGEDLEAGTFLMEYVGEVINLKQFEKRKKIYAKDSSTHYYFMALKSDSIIDATMKGNISRFINHSCDPNSETQKWTVNGELRIGFFTKSPVKAGEELTFDYQYERYGKEAQRCYCESANCRGWIGDVPSDEEESESEISDEESPAIQPESPKTESEVPASADVSEKAVQVEEKEEEEAKPEAESEKIEVEKEENEKKEIVEKPKPRKRRSRTLRVFQEEDDLDFQIAQLLKTGLKNKTQTLTFCRLLVRAERLESKRSLLSLLAEDRSDPACRRLLLDYHGLKLLGCWLADPGTSEEMKLEILRAVGSLPIPNRTMIKDSKFYSLVEKWANDEDSVEQDRRKRTSDSGTPSENESPTVDTGEIRSEIRPLSQQLLESWSALKEVFRIPKRERIEAMKEHEREADRNEPKPDPRSWPNRRSFENRSDRWAYSDRHEREYRRRDHLSPDWRRREYGDSLSKDERRQRFMLQVQREEEEMRKRKRREELARNHEAQCKALGIDSSAVPLFIDPQTGDPVTQPPPPPDPGVDPSSLTYYIDPLTGQWTVYMPEHMQLPPGYDPSTIGRFSYDSHTGMMIESNSGYQLDPTQPLGIAEFLMANYPVKHMDFDPNEDSYPPGTLIFNLETGDMQIVREQRSVITHAVNIVAEQPLEEKEKPTRTDFKLPPKWASATDPEGRTYYYHIKDRVPQWNQPELPQDGDSESGESETDSDEEDESMDVDQNASTSNGTPPVSDGSRRERRRGLLVKEFLISPRDESEGKNPYLSKESALAHRKQLIKEKSPKKFLPEDKEKSEKMREKIRKEKERLKAKYKATLKKLSNAEKKIKDKKIKQKVKMEELSKKKALQAEALRSRIKEKLESSVYAVSDMKETDEDSTQIGESQENTELETQESQESSLLMRDNVKSFERTEENNTESVLEKETIEDLETVQLPPTPVTTENPEENSAAPSETVPMPPESTEAPENEEHAEENEEEKQKVKIKKEKEKVLVLDFETDKGKKIKEDFRKGISHVVVSTLNPFFKPDAKYARITSNDDFKHLARKFTHFVMQKEMKHCKTIEEYICNDSIKQKAKDFIRKYMKKFGPVYRKGLDEDLKI